MKSKDNRKKAKRRKIIRPLRRQNAPSKPRKAGELMKILGRDDTRLDKKVDKEFKKADKAEKEAAKETTVKELKLSEGKIVKIWKFEMEITRNFLILFILDAILAGSMLTINYFIFREETTIFSLINLIAAFVFIFPIVMVKYTKYRKRKEIEELFPIFLRDFVESIRGGMTVPRALKSVSRNDYKSLNPHVKKMAVQLDWGVPVEKALLNFSKRSKSKLIGRIISSVRESHRFGGNLADTLDALSNTAVEVERLRQERQLYLHSQMITGYIIFFVFLAVIIALEKFLVPSLAQVASTGYIGSTQVIQTGDVENLVEEYKMVFRNLILLQGFFAGLSVGKMAEGAIVAGLKHSMFMMFIGSLVFTIAA